MSRAIGIDLGTYNSAGTFVYSRDKLIMIENRYRKKNTNEKCHPSFVFFDENGKKQLVGIAAKAMGRESKLNIWGVKRLVGLSFLEAKNRGEFKRFQYDIEEDENRDIVIKIGEKYYSPSDILAIILHEIKEDAENIKVNPLLGGEKIEKVVISIPAYYLAVRTGHIINAAEKAGFTDIKTIPEPSAAAIAYGLKIEKEAYLFTFDMGAGTLDVTVMQQILIGKDIAPGELGISGNEALGGLDMDDALVDYIINKYNLLEMRENYGDMSILKDLIETAKINLSYKTTDNLLLPPNELPIQLTREELEDVIKPILEKCRGPIREAILASKLKANEIDNILFVGGPTKMPCVRNLVKDELTKFGVRKEVIAQIDLIEKNGFPIDPMECVARGAALKAAGIIEPVVVRTQEGYGTSFGPVKNLPNYYKPIIKNNAPYPVKDSTGIISGNPNALVVDVNVVATRPYIQENKMSYKYIANSI